MRNYRIPFNVKFEDKVLGGKLTIRQGIWYSMPVILALLLIQNSSMTTKVVNGKSYLDWNSVVIYIFIDIVLFIIATVFSFIKINGFTLDCYLIKKISYLERNRNIKFNK